MARAAAAVCCMVATAAASPMNLTATSDHRQLRGIAGSVSLGGYTQDAVSAIEDLSVTCFLRNGTLIDGDTWWTNPAGVYGQHGCDQKCKGIDESGYFCTKEYTLDLGFMVQEDYRSCQDVMLPLFNPSFFLMPKGIQAGVLGFFLGFLFLGVAVVADVFMAAIEKITSKEKRVKVTDPVTGELLDVKVAFWNPTVANLTLLALGSSAPEILLAVIGTVGTLGGEPDELGASTIVGSAAFNLLAITAVCIVSCPSGEVRKVTQVYVFICTSAWSIFAYGWLIVILELWTPDEVTLVEAIITAGSMGGMVLSAFWIDKWERKLSPADAHQEDGQPGASKDGWVGGNSAFKTGMGGAHVVGVDISGGPGADRNEITRLLQSMDNPDPAEAARMLMSSMPTKQISRIQARMTASKVLSGKKSYAPGTTKKPAPATVNEPTDIQTAGEVMPLTGGPRKAGERDGVMISFDTSTLICRESQGTVKLTVSLSAACTYPISVDYATVAGTAEPGKDFIHVQGTLTFEPGSKEEAISVSLIEDEEFEPDETFTVHLSKSTAGAKLAAPSQMLIIVVDDHEPGQIGFGKRFYSVKESEEFAIVPVNRTYGSAGRVTIDYETVDGVAVAGRDYVTTKGTLVFEDGETAKDIKIPIILDETPDEHENFCISLANVNGGASMGKLNMSVLTIVSDTDIDSVASTLANLIRQRDGILGQGEQSAWSAQFIEAIELEGNVNELGETVPPTPFQACMHFVTIFWKLLFATIPPTDMCGGWATFGVALSFIGVVTAVVGDVATLFGCVLGLKNSVTAISVVALGTSLPDTFASKQAVTEGNDADAAVGNITGSNSVNVFLGLGLPYLIGTIYSISKGEKYCNPAGSLVFSVIVYSSLALACLALLAYRRKACGAELGGNNATKYFHAVILVLMWVCYITLSSLQAYEIIGSAPRASLCFNGPSIAV